MRFESRWWSGLETTQHPTQYFELLANRGVYDNGWMANTVPLRLPWAKVALGTPTPKPDDFQRELYHVAEDVAQANNVAGQNPKKLKELQAVFDREAMLFLSASSHKFQPGCFPPPSWNTF